MQDRYAGDVGDFLKLGLLRSLAGSADGHEALRVGVNWYRTPDEDDNADGKHVGYLAPSSRWHSALASCDPDLMGRMSVFRSGRRAIETLGAIGALPPGTVAFAESIVPGLSAVARQAWHARAVAALSAAELVFVDPDNGIRAGGRRGALHKHALLSELADYARRGQSLVVYHHADRSGDAVTQARRPLSEVAEATGLIPSGTVIGRRGTCRLFLVVAQDGHQAALQERRLKHCQRWTPHVMLVIPGPDERHARHLAAGDPRSAPSDAQRYVERRELRARDGRLSAVSLDYSAAEAFIASIPDGRWTSYGDVADAAGNRKAAMSIGNWLRSSSGSIDRYWRVINEKGRVPEGFIASAAGLPTDAVSARERLASEGVDFDRSRASRRCRYTVEEWRAAGRR